ncbi:MAG: Transaldolase [Candidatus Omnitrophica bacterium]|nr:Transaldolase [Candidatus Omnitrophota bacterium]
MPGMEMAMQSRLGQALKYGQSFWYDGLIGAAEFDRLIREDGVRGATTNPAIFEKALNSSAYDADIRRLAASGHDAEEIYRQLAVRTVAEVADLFSGVHRDSSGADGYVSIEVSPRLAYDTAGTVREALDLWGRLARPNVMIKVPATREGLPAVAELIARGIHVNVTLIFSVERYRQVMDAYLSGLERRAATGASPAGISSVASFFVSRVDSSVDALLEKRYPSGDAVRSELEGRLAIANCKAAYREFRQAFTSERFRVLERAGARVQRPLWASTGTKNPKYSDVLYVETLIGPDTVNTMPPATMDAFRDHGTAADTLQQGTEAALAALETARRSGIDLDAITADLEGQGVKLFVDAYDKIISSIGAKIR